MKRFVKISGQFVTDGNFNKIKLTKSQALSIAKRQTKRLGLQDCKMQYHINENDQSYSIIVHTGEIK
ncbi:hypothetical protein phiA047_0166 [Aeromonas phage phiA047]|nr:hypothetical protein phiA047_0166 [Aeromonas phage phiA047]